MTVVNPKSISGITSITTASGSDNLLTIHTSDANNTERLRIDSTGTTKIVTGIVTTLTATGSANFSDNVIVNGGNITVKQPAGTEAKIQINEATTTNSFTIKQTATEARIQTNASQPFNIRSQAGTGSTSHLAFWTRDTEKLRIDSNGRILIGHSSTPTAALSVAIVGSYGGSSTNTPFVYICRDEAATAISGGESLGQILFASNDAYRGAVIEGEAAGAWSGSSSDASLVFKTTPDNATVPTERLRITSSGRVGINTDAPDAKLEVRDSGATGIIIRSTQTQATDTNKAIRVRNNSDTDTFSVSHKGKVYPLDNIVMASGKGIDFSATSDAGGMGSELLDDYEEGTWTPAWGGASVFGTTSYSTNQAAYKKIGRLVFVSGYTEVTGNTGGSGAWNCNNLPFLGDNGTYYVSPGSCFMHSFNLPDNTLWVVPYKNSNTSHMSLYYTRDNTAWSQLQVSHDTAFRIIFSVTYHASA